MRASSWHDDLLRDFVRYTPTGSTSTLSLIGCFLRHPGFRATASYRIGQAVARRRIGLFAAAVTWRVGRLLSGATLSPQSQIAGGLLLPHPEGVIVGAGTRVESGVTIQQRVTIGGNMGRTSVTGREKPVIGAGTFLGPGSVIAGPVTLGAGSRVAANVLVTTDIPAGSTVTPPRPKVRPPTTQLEAPQD